METVVFEMSAGRALSEKVPAKRSRRAQVGSFILIKGKLKRKKGKREGRKEGKGKERGEEGREGREREEKKERKKDRLFPTPGKVCS